MHPQESIHDGHTSLTGHFYRQCSREIIQLVNPSVWICETYVVNHLVGTGLRCARLTCVVHHQTALCTTVFLCLNILLIRGDILILVCLYYFTIDFSFVLIRWCTRRFCMFVIKFIYGVQCSVVSLSVCSSVSALTIVVRQKKYTKRWTGNVFYTSGISC